MNLFPFFVESPLDDMWKSLLCLAVNMDAQTVWQQALSHLQTTDSSSFKVYFHQAQVEGLQDRDNGKALSVRVPNPYIKQVIESRYQPQIEQSLSTLLGTACTLSLSIGTTTEIDASEESADEPATTGQTVDIPLFSTQTQSNIQQQQAQNRINDAIIKALLRKEYTFENFAVSPSNEVAYAGATAVAKNPGTAYNPLFLYGDVGVGKTHLMHAVGIRILENNPDAKMVYCMGEQFTNEIIEAIQNKKTPEFRNRYRPSQVLMIDDIQFIAGKNTVQEEFFHTFNAIQSAGGQVILTSDKPPHEIKLLEDRLRSRFEEGLTIDIQMPNFELRTAILLIKAKQMRKELPMDVAQTIANHITSTRQLQGFLSKLYATATLKNRVVSTDLALEMLRQQSPEEGTPPPMIQKTYLNPREVVKIVAKFFNVTEQQLYGPKRARPIVLPRQKAMYLLRTDLNMSFPEIGHLFGGRDHSTVIHSVEKIAQEVANSESLQVEFSTIRKLVYG